MTILESILKNALGHEMGVKGTGYHSPPPEHVGNLTRKRKKQPGRVTSSRTLLFILRWTENTSEAARGRRTHSTVGCLVTGARIFAPISMTTYRRRWTTNHLPKHYFKPHRLEAYRSTLLQNHLTNVQLLTNILQIYRQGGKVDCWWRSPPPECKCTHTEERLNAAKNIDRFNKIFNKLLQQTGPKVETTRELDLYWERNKKRILEIVQKPFILFDMNPKFSCNDPAFECPDGVKRPRVQLELVVRNGYKLGSLLVELFTDVCPETCALFMTLLRGDTVGYSYVGTQFFRVVPGLYWSGGDVTHNNGYGCYAAEGRNKPMCAENYHFSHTMPGLVTMRVTEYDEVCGHFNILFKAMPQLDLKNVVFGRVLGDGLLQAMREFGRDSKSRPHVSIGATYYTQQDARCSGKINNKIRDDLYWRRMRARLKESHAVR